MSKGRTLIVALVAIVVGFFAGFVLRPVISPARPTPTEAARAVVSTVTGARGTEYFAAHIEEARKVLSGCRNGSVRGDECANAKRAVTEAEGRDRFKKFIGH